MDASWRWYMTRFLSMRVLVPTCGPSARTGTRLIGVAACNRNGLDLQSSHFSTGINCVYPSQQTEIICE
ncbi:hypothetical protein BKM09_030485 [Pseudomonas amygdali pv. morsprunorum]|nr:hypothetical protein BKM09_030485 [Pseudomonas amygdali pv. morsprunorum]